MISILDLDNGGIREAFMAYHKYLDKKAEELSLSSYKEPALPGLSSFTSDQVHHKRSNWILIGETKDGFGFYWKFFKNSATACLSDKISTYRRN